MRRALAISLLMFFSFMLMAPLLTPDTEANLPACCRRGGKHHCAMSMAAAANRSERGFTTVTEKCPCCPFGGGAVYSPAFKLEARDAFFVEERPNPARNPQTQALYRLSLFRSHQKRGPPDSSILA